ncbi:unnamed protein product [Paramecium octaurelia]|uniref:Uncharacterized protein n=1 Tax=Paramecium octaurelia TaxID=43137 RepID=A0A8S1VJE2_PAROT|nr:unnamed protein product [Paramecium octaurelia]
MIQQCLVFLSLILIALSQDCLDQDGNPVDWWFILKMPYSRKNGWSGLHYFYCDSVNNCDDFDLQQDDLDSEESPLIRTISPINFKEKDVLSMLWSDQPQEGVDYSNNAHSKGIMRASLNGNNKAFIISHSTPRFPKLNSEGEIDNEVDDNFHRNGQHFLCLSTTTSDINEHLAELYIEAEISIYQHSATPDKGVKFNEFEHLVDLWATRRSSRKSGASAYKKSTELKKQLTFETRGGQSFEIFSKNENYKKDFYAEVVAPHLKQDFVLESWVRQYKVKGLQEADCDNKYKTFSNEVVKYTGTYDDELIEFEYRYTKDHSKYGITLPKDSGSGSAGASFITNTQHTLQGQILASNEHSRKREGQVFLEGDDDKMLRRKRQRDEEEEVSVSDERTTEKRRRKDGKTSSKKLKVIHEKYVCISDLNRQPSQWERGGLVYCFYNEGLWKIIKEAFIGVQTC